MTTSMTRTSLAFPRTKPGGFRTWKTVLSEMRIDPKVMLLMRNSKANPRNPRRPRLSSTVERFWVKALWVAGKNCRKTSCTTERA